MLTAVVLIRFELGPDWLMMAWVALILALVAVAWKTRRRIFRDQGLFLAFLILFRAVFHNFYERSYCPAPFWHGRILCVGLTVAPLSGALFFGFKLRLRPDESPANLHWLATLFGVIDRRPDQVFFFAPLVLLTALLAAEVSRGLVTLSWGIEAVMIVMFALRVRERSFRLSGPGLAAADSIRVG